MARQSRWHVASLLALLALATVPACGGPTTPSPPAGARASLSGVIANATAGSLSGLSGARIDVISGVNVGRSTSADPSGHYRLDNLDLGTMTVRASAAGYVPVSRDVSLAVDQSADFSLASAAVSTGGRVFEALTQAGVGSVSITGAGIIEAQSDASGAFTVASANGIGDPLLAIFSGATTVERRTYVRVPGPAAQVSLIAGGFDLHAFDEMCRATMLLRWSDPPPMTVENRLLQFASTSENSPLALAEQMSQADHDALVADLTWALPQLTGDHFHAFTDVMRQTSDAGARVLMLNSGRITVARYAGLTTATGYWGYSRWQFRGDGTVTGGMIMLDRDFERSNSPYHRSLHAHELGHALGYNHVTVRSSVMNPVATIEPNDFDRDATRIAFLRPPGNRTPDTDPSAFSTNLLRATLTWSAPIR